MSFRFQVTLSKDAGSLRRTQSGAIFSVDLLPKRFLCPRSLIYFPLQSAAFSESCLSVFPQAPFLLGFLAEYFLTLL